MKKQIQKRHKKTAGLFFDAFVLISYWKCDPSSLKSSYSTVDSLVKVLMRNGLLSKEETEAFYLRFSVRDYIINRTLFEKFSGRKLNKVMSAPTTFCVSIPTDSTAVEQKRYVLLDTRLHLTEKGRMYAASIEGKLDAWITKESYLESVAELFPVGKTFSATAMQHRREKIQGKKRVLDVKSRTRRR